MLALYLIRDIDHILCLNSSEFLNYTSKYKHNCEQITALLEIDSEYKAVQYMKLLNKLKECSYHLRR